MQSIIKTSCGNDKAKEFLKEINKVKDKGIYELNCSLKTLKIKYLPYNFAESLLCKINNKENENSIDKLKIDIDKLLEVIIGDSYKNKEILNMLKTKDSCESVLKFIKNMRENKDNVYTSEEKIECIIDAILCSKENGEEIKKYLIDELNLLTFIDDEKKSELLNELRKINKVSEIKKFLILALKNILKGKLYDGDSNSDKENWSLFKNDIVKFEKEIDELKENYNFLDEVKNIYNRIKQLAKENEEYILLKIGKIKENVEQNILEYILKYYEKQDSKGLNYFELKDAIKEKFITKKQDSIRCHIESIFNDEGNDKATAGINNLDIADIDIFSKILNIQIIIVFKIRFLGFFSLIFIL